MKQLLVMVALVVLSGPTFGQTKYYSTDAVAINGYDPVAYFSGKSPVKGSKEFSYKWEGTEWHFSSQSNLETFKANPGKYAPQFGGYCAYGAAQNHKSITDPAAFTIVNDKLYLNYSPKVKELWAKDTAGNIVKAEKNWPALIGQK